MIKKVKNNVQWTYNTETDYNTKINEIEEKITSYCLHLIILQQE